MGEISGVSTTDLNNVDGFFTTQGGGGTASLSPTLSITGTPFGATLVISNYASYTNPNWHVEVFVGATQIVTNAQVVRSLNGNFYSDTLEWSDTSALTGARTVKVRAQTFGNFVQSAEVTTTYTKATVNFTYLRLRGVTSAGANTANRLGLRNVRFFEAASQSGTQWAAGNMTSNTAPTSNGVTLSQGHLFSSTYEAWRAMDGTTQMAWLLGTNATNNWWQCQFTGTVPTIKSMLIFQTTNADTSYIKLSGSNTGAFAGEETDLGIFYVPNNNTQTNLG
jgi:hypothetical protein